MPTAPTNTPISPAPTNQPDLSGIKSTIDTLNSTLNEITERMDTIEDQVANPPAPTPPPAKEPTWEPKSWADVPKKSEEIAKQVVEDALKAKEEATEAERQAQEAKKKVIDQEFENQIKELEDSGKIPKVAKPDDENDAGRQARREIYGLGVHYDSPNLKKMAELRDNFTKAGYKYDPKADKLIRVGTSPTYTVEAPVSGGGKAISKEGKPEYKTIHASSMDAMLRAFNEGQI